MRTMEMAGAHPALVFAAGDVAHVMEPVFDAPVSPHELRDRFGGGPSGGERGRAMDGLAPDFSGGADAPLAFDAEGDPAMGQRGLGAGGQVDDPAGAGLAPSMPPVRGAMLARQNNRGENHQRKFLARALTSFMFGRLFFSTGPGTFPPPAPTGRCLRFRAHRSSARAFVSLR